MAHAVLVERYTRRVEVEQHAAIAALSQGAEDVDVPDLETELAKFTRALEDDATGDAEQPTELMELRLAIGLPARSAQLQRR